MLSSIVAASLLAAGAAAHGYVSSIKLDGVDVPGWAPYNDPYINPPVERVVRKFNSNGPIEDVSGIGILCNTNGGSNNVPVGKHAPVSAGSDVTFTWTDWPASHVGPVMTYMANCGGDCSTFSGANSPVWFKIDEEGLYADGTWAAEKVTKTSKWTSRIPSDLAPGKYLIRHEILALHSANNMNGAQFYPMCMQVDLKSSGNAVPKNLVSFPGAYKNTDPGIYINIYYPKVEKYDIPGPRPYAVGSGSTTDVQPPSSTPAGPSSSTSSSSAPASSSPAACASPKAAWDQCGGRDYRGSTCCVAGYTCTYSNDWYSQCIPTPKTTSSSVPAPPSSSSSSSKSSSSSSSSTSPSSSASVCTNPSATVTITQTVSASGPSATAGRYAAYNKCVALAALSASDDTPVDLSSCSASGRKRHFQTRRFF